jgi:hypothetical protein
MGLSYHNMYAADGLEYFQVADRIYFGTQDVVYTSAAGAGSAVSTTVSWTEPVPTPYAVFVSPVEDSAYYITSKTTTSFVLNMTPRTAALSLAGGTAVCVIVA